MSIFPAANQLVSGWSEDERQDAEPCKGRQCSGLYLARELAVSKFLPRRRGLCVLRGLGESLPEDSRMPACTSMYTCCSGIVLSIKIVSRDATAKMMGANAAAPTHPQQVSHTMSYHTLQSAESREQRTEWHRQPLEIVATRGQTQAPENSHTCICHSFHRRPGFPRAGGGLPIAH